jgi:membrane protease subunit HflK
VLALVLFVLGGAVVVPPGHRGVVERFGFPLAEVREPGLALTLPPPIEQVVLVDVDRVRRVGVVESDTPLLTGDQSMVSIRAVLHYRVETAHAFAYGAQEPEQILADLARAALVRAVGTLTQDEVLTSGRRQLEEQVTVAAQALATQAELGIEVLDTRLALAIPPPPVLSAFMDVISADEEKRSSIHLAEAYAARTVPIARGNSLALLEQAIGESAALSSRVDVEHSHLKALVVGGARSPALTRFRVGREMLEKTLSDARLVIAPRSIRIWLGDSIAEPVDPSRFGSKP